MVPVGLFCSFLKKYLKEAINISAYFMYNITIVKA